MPLPDLVAVNSSPVRENARFEPDTAQRNDPRFLSQLSDARFDALVLVAGELPTGLGPVDTAVARASALDQRVGREITLVPAPEVAGGRLILAPTGPLDRDYDDVRRVAEAARAGFLRAREAGARRPLLLVTGAGRFEQAEHSALLAGLSALWVPLEAREAHGEARFSQIERVGLCAPEAEQIVQRVRALESGRSLARDLCGTEPERMRPEAFAADCIDAFVDSAVTVRVIEDLDTLSYQYPLLMGVARASLAVERHRPRVISLEYTGAGPIERTLLLAE